jgi:Tfp pilus assembly protein PilE
MKISNESGRSMVEMLGVLAIIGVLSVGGIAGYSKAMNKYKINKTTDQVSMLVANIRTLYSTQGHYKNLDNKKAKQFGIVPNDMYTSTSDTTITNAFKGAVTIAADHARSGKAGTNDPFDAFTIQYDGLSSEACVSIVTGDWGSGQASGLIGIAAGKTNVSDVSKLYVDNTDSAKHDSGIVIAAPGGVGVVKATKEGEKDSTVSVTTPVSVTYAVAACSGASSNGSGYSVAWKYY